MQARNIVFAESISDFGAFVFLQGGQGRGAVANSVVDIVFQSSARDTIACLAKSAKASIGLLRRHYDVCNIVSIFS